jgi:protein-tyrosine phosphatase
VDEIPLPAGAGRLWLCGKHAIAPDPARLLAQTGAGALVCLVEEHELADRYPAYVHWLRTDPRARWWPVPDLHAPDVATARTYVAALRELASGGVVVHCGAGIGRAGTMAAALLIDLGLTADEAVERVGAYRPMAGPEAGAQRELLAALGHPGAVGSAGDPLG